MNLTTTIVALTFLSVGPAPIESPEPLVIHWRIELIQVRDADKEADDSKLNRPAPPHIKPPDRRIERAVINAYAPPEKATQTSWGPDIFKLLNRDTGAGKVDVTLVEDDDVADLNGLSVRLRSWRAHEIAGAREIPLSKSKRVEYIDVAGILTYVNGKQAAYCTTRDFRPSKKANECNDNRAWTWNSTAVSMSCDSFQDGMVSVNQLRVGHWLIGNDAARTGAEGETAYPIKAGAVAESSFWLAPRQTAVVRLPRAKGDGGQTIALVKAFVADTRASNQLRSGIPPHEPDGPVPEAPLSPDGFRLLETP